MDAIRNQTYSFSNDRFGFNGETTPATAALADIIEALDNGNTDKALHETVNFAVSLGIGANPQYVENTLTACLDFFGHDEKTRKDYEMFVLRLLSVPQSQLDDIYIDELGLSGKEAGSMTPEQLAQRYAEYKVKRGYFLTPWAWDDKERLDKAKASVVKKMKERLEGKNSKETIEAYNELKARNDAVAKKVSKANKLMEEDYVAASQAFAELQQDPDYSLYELFSGGEYGYNLDRELGELTKLWLKSKSVEEADLIADAISSYREGMVEALQAETNGEREETLKCLEDLLEEFYAKWERLRPSGY